MNVLGISCFYHDAAAALLRDGEPIAAAEEERFSRQKHDPRFPYSAIRYCLDAAGIAAEDLEHVAFYEKPIRKFRRIVMAAIATYPTSVAPFTQAMSAWLPQKLWTQRCIRRELGPRPQIHFLEHHLSHAASAFFPSPFQHAAVLTADGVGEWATTTLGVGRGADLEIIKEIHYPHSLGLLYSAITAYLGHEVNEGEYKVMGMAAYGRPRHVDRIRRLITIAQDGGFRLDMRYFDHHRGIRAFSNALVELLGPPRLHDSDVEERHVDIAASVQAVVEEALVAIAQEARRVTGESSLCMAGGVALNVLANSRVLRDAGFADIWIQPAAGDSGGALGAALYVQHAALRQPRAYIMDHAYLGPEYGDARIHGFLEAHRIPHRVLAASELVETAAELLAAGRVIGWFQGRMEFGPRALGARSILADPTDPRMKDRVNEKVKHREPFRPFAPAVVHEEADRFFEFEGSYPLRDSPFMLLVAKVRSDQRDRVPAVTHADGTARVQTVRREQNPLFYDLLRAFGRRSGVPILLNTSFNVRGEPIVRTPEEAFNSFSHTELDALVLGRALIPASSKRRLAPYPGTLKVQPHEVVF